MSQDYSFFRHVLSMDTYFPSYLTCVFSDCLCKAPWITYFSFICYNFPFVLSVTVPSMAKFSLHQYHTSCLIGCYFSFNKCVREALSKPPDSKVHVANMGPTWVLSPPNGPHVGPINLAIRVMCLYSNGIHLYCRHETYSRRKGHSDDECRRWHPQQSRRKPFYILSLFGTYFVGRGRGCLCMDRH